MFGNEKKAVVTPVNNYLPGERYNLRIFLNDGNRYIMYFNTVTENRVTGVILNKAATSLAVGDTAQLTETVDPANATNKNVTWASSDESVATVSSNGLVTAVAAGTATITVTTYDGNFTANCVVTVTAAEPPAPYQMGDKTFNAAFGIFTGTITGPDLTGLTVELHGTISGKIAKVPVDAATGTFLMTGFSEDLIGHTYKVVKAGNVVLEGTPTFTSIPPTGITVAPTTLSMTIAETAQLTETVDPANATNKNVTWASSDESVATVDANGNLTAFSAGTTTITVTTVDGDYTAICTVNVVAPQTLSLSEAIGQPSWNVTTGGDASWTAVSDQIHNGGVQSGRISHGQHTWMETFVQGPGELSFYWKVSSENNYDFLEFYINDQLQDQISGEVNWQEKTYQLGSGTNTHIQ